MALKRTYSDPRELLSDIIEERPFATETEIVNRCKRELRRLDDEGREKILDEVVQELVLSHGRQIAH
ncbi:MAG TPA: hypothetical protein VMU06_12955 [Stellaceae bacterium]|nr:hypothetical protein [Stellaceae bacterium]